MKKSFIYAFTAVTFTVVSGQEITHPSPGGIQGAEIWFKTVPITEEEMQGKYKWQDFAGDGAKFNNYNSAEYTLTRAQIRTYNFNPALNPAAAGLKNKEIILKNNNLSQATILGVFAPDGEFNQETFLYMVNGRAGEGIVATKSKIIESQESGKPPLDYGKEEGKNLLMPSGLTTAEQSKYHESVLKSMTYYRSIQPSLSVWSEKKSSVITLGSLQSTDKNITSEFSGVPTRIFSGYVPEYIAYGRLLTPLERRKIETYLAVKYAFTLDKSYIANNGDLVWDKEANQPYNYRITGVAREDNSGLYQTFSATSYEEAPYFSDVYDTYYQNNSNYKATPNRLLFVGRQNASPLEDGEYILWGDNNAPVNTTFRNGMAGLRIMQRQWLLNTNRAPATAESQNVEFKISALTVAAQNFTATITKSKDDAQTTGTLTTATALKTKNGYFSFDTSFSLNTGTIEIKFGTAKASLTEGSHDYGYRINSNGYIYRIIKGKTNSTLIDIAHTGNTIEIEKTETRVYLWVNGIRQDKGTITIEKADLEQTYYGSLSIAKGTQNIVLNHFRHGGFADTGNRLELSYISTAAKEFKNYRSDEKTYLLIDRSGTGNFPEGQVDYYPADDLDETRSKIIFNNIFWNTQDIFTFGYRTTNLVAEITGISADCEDINSSDGKIEIRIKHGYPGYTYVLTDKAAQNIIKSGSFYGDTCQIDSLKAGVYLLKLKEIGGANLLNHSNDPSAPTLATGVSLTSNTYSATSAFEFTPIDSSSYDIGFTTAKNNASAITINYGVKVENNHLYALVGGTVTSQPVAELKAEDRIRIERTTKNLSIKINDVQVYTQSFSSVTTAMYLGANQYGEGKILNIKIPSSTTLPSWRADTTGVKTEISTSDEIIEEVTLPKDCQEVIVLPPAGKFPDFIIYYKHMEDMSVETVKLTLEEPSAANLIVFSMIGALVYQDEHKTPAVEHEFDVKVLPAGAYVVKVITHQKEYSGRLLIKP
jgi:hypothetical protein